MRALAFVSAAVACILSARAAGLNQLQVKKARLWTRMCPFNSFDDDTSRFKTICSAGTLILPCRKPSMIQDEGYRHAAAASTASSSCKETSDDDVIRCIEPHQADLKQYLGL